MANWERAVSAVGPLRTLIILGTLHVTVGAILAGFQVVNADLIQGAILDFVLIGGPGLALLYGSRWVPQTNIDPEVYPRIVLWVFSGLSVMLIAVGLLIINPGGEITRAFWAIAMAAAFGALGGFPIGINEARAITRAREAERRNRELEQMQARLSETVDQLTESNERLEQFAYAASHDLQEPLRMVSSYVQLIEQRYANELDEDGVEFLQFAVDGAERMREMIDALLEYSRVEAQGDPFEPVALDPVLDSVRDDLAVTIEESEADISIVELPCVEGDERQLRQLFQNLLDNAIEYSGETPPRVSIQAERDGDEWQISVRDNGIGIDPDHIDTVFQVFQRLHSREDHAGTGIGLALCERIVERHGGDIWVESDPGEGTTFLFSLPAVDDHE